MLCLTGGGAQLRQQLQNGAGRDPLGPRPTM